MEPPAKRQRLSQAESYPAPSRTIDLNQLQWNLNRRNRPGRVILPRAPDVTVTAAVLEVAINEGSLAVEVTPASTGSVAVTLSNLGTLTIPGVTVTPAADSSSGRSSISDFSTTISSTTHSNSTTTSSDRTITVTATNTFHVSYTNGTFITPSQTYKSRPTASDSNDDYSSTSESTAYVFGQGVTETSHPVTRVSGTQYNSATSANPTISTTSPTGTGNTSNEPSGPILTPQQTQMVGGIVGGVAGIAFVIVVVLYVLRWYRQRLKQQGRLPQQLDSSHDHDLDYGDKALVSMAAPMSQTSRSPFFAPMALKKFRPRSDITDNTVSTTTESEKGFKRVSGRKIPSVLSTGGDQYGGSFGAFEKEMGGSVVKTRTLEAMPSIQNHDMSEKSFYREGDGIPSRTNLLGSAPYSAPVSPISPAAAYTTYINHSRPRPHPARRPDVPLPNTTSALASPTKASPYTRHLHNESATSVDSQFDPMTFNAAFQRNIAIMSNVAHVQPKVEGFAVSRNSPARTPNIQSPGPGTLRLPMGVTAGYSMDDDVPEMPLPSPGMAIGGVRVPSGLSAVSSGRDSSFSGRFREDF